MAITNYGYDGVLLEAGWAKLSRYLGRAQAITSAGALAPTAVGGVDRTTRLAVGGHFAQGVLVETDATIDLQSATLGSGTRWDTVVLRRDWSTNTSSFVVVSGTATKALASGLNNNPGVLHDTPIALVQITAGTQAPTAVIDLRPAFGDDRVEIGVEMMWPTTTPPSGYLLEDGSAVDRVKYAALFAIMGTTFGAGDGSTTFNLPNKKGRVVVGRDAAQTEFDTIGETGGAKAVALVAGEMPAHTHANSHNHGGTSGSTSISHAHTINHGHGRAFGATYGGAGNHAHSVGMSDFGGLGGGGTLVRLGYNGSFPSGTGGAGAHDHSAYADVADFNGGSGSADPAHTHPIPTDNTATGSSGSGTAHQNLQPYIVQNFIVKAY